MLTLLRGARAALSVFILGISVPLAMAQHGTLDPADPAHVLALGRKVYCSTIDDKPIVFWWHGAAYGRRQGEPDRHLFDVEGMNIRACSSIQDAERGAGYALVSREILLYLDKDSGQPLATWDNPWTGETVDVLHVANDPVNFQVYETGRDGTPSTWGGEVNHGQWWMRSTIPLWYANPLGGGYQAEIGGVHHAAELFSFFGRTEDLLDPETTTAMVTIGYSRMSNWLPWMRMSGREGLLWFHTSGAKLKAWEDLSERMKSEILTHYPDYVAPPLRGDTRENMTSLKYYKGVEEGTIIPPDRSQSIK